LRRAWAASGGHFLCVVIGSIAKSRGRDATQWFAAALFFSPLVAAIILALLLNIREQQIALLAHAILVPA